MTTEQGSMSVWWWWQSLQGQSSPHRGRQGHREEGGRGGGGERGMQGEKDAGRKSAYSLPLYVLLPSILSLLQQ